MILAINSQTRANVAVQARFTDFIDTGRCKKYPNWWAKFRPEACEYYGQGSNHLECMFDKVTGLADLAKCPGCETELVAAQVCPECQVCSDWRDECTEAVPGWACDCAGNVADCYGNCPGSCEALEGQVCGRGPICTDECENWTDLYG